MIKQHDE